MIVKMLTHVHMLVYTLWCWHTLERRWSLNVDSALFKKMKCISSIAPVGKLDKSRECFSLKNTHRTLTSRAPDAESEHPVLIMPCSARVRHWTLGTGRRLEHPVFESNVRAFCSAPWV